MVFYTSYYCTTATFIAFIELVLSPAIPRFVKDKEILRIKVLSQNNIITNTVIVDCKYILVYILLIVDT